VPVIAMKVVISPPPKKKYVIIKAATANAIPRA
jgi:hypothetical protein